MCSTGVTFPPRGPDYEVSTECSRRCATAQLRHAAALSRQAPGVQKRLSFAYFSLPLQRKVGAAPHRGNARAAKAHRGRQRKKKTARAAKTQTRRLRRRQYKRSTPNDRPLHL